MRRQRDVVTSAADRLAAALEELSRMDAAALDRRWRQLFGVAPPAGLSPALRLRVIAYRLQAIACGDLDRATTQALDRLGRRGNAGRDCAGSQGTAGRRGSKGQGEHEAAAIVLPVPDRRGQRPGTVLTREWGGAMHTVMVLETGYAWNGAAYDSLSKVAHAITGTKWNGPRFFGLRARAAQSSDAGRVTV